MSLVHNFSHNDLDGVMPAALLREAYGDRVGKTYFCSYKNINNRLESFLKKNKNLDDIIFITDLSVNEEMAIALEERHKQGQKIVMLDHHFTNLHMNEYEWATVTAEIDGVLTCATSLMYDYLLENGLLQDSLLYRTFVEYVRSYDTWDWYKEKNRRAKQLNDFFFMFTIKESTSIISSILQGNNKEEEFAFPEKYDFLLEVETNRIDKYLYDKNKELRFVTINDMQVGLVYAELYHSELGAYLSEQHPDLHYIMIIDFSSRKGSLRTNREDVDVESIAKSYGGGGHKKASGFLLTKENYLDFLLFE